MIDRKTFGLDIGATSIKAVWLNLDKGGFVLKSSIVCPVPEKGMLSESPLDQEEMANAIKRTVIAARINIKDVNLALPENQVYTKVIEMPALSDKELSLAINWEAEQYIPVPLSTVSLVWSVLNPPQKKNTISKKLQILVVGAPNMLINKYQKLITMAGLNPVSVETEILSVIRALTYQKDMDVSKSPPSIILNIGAVSTSLALIKDGIVVFTYSIPVGGIAINRAIEADLGISQAQAEEYKKAYGYVSSGPAIRVGKAMQPILNTIFAEVKKVIVFYSQRYKEDSLIAQILLSGGTARLPGIDLFFAENAGIETVIADPWRILSPNAKISDDARSNGSDYAIAIGLAMRGYV